MKCVVKKTDKCVRGGHGSGGREGSPLTEWLVIQILFYLSQCDVSFANESNL